MTSTTRNNSSLGIAIGVLAGAVVCSLLAGIAWTADHPDFARGIVLGGTIDIAAAVTLKVLSRTRFANAEARLAAGQADERERSLAVRSLATAAAAMYAAAVICAFATMFGLEAQASLAIIMFTGLIATSSTFALLARRA